MARRKHTRRYDDPLRHPDHPRPRTRREFLSQDSSSVGIVAGRVTLTLASGKAVALSGSLGGMLAACGIDIQGAGRFLHLLDLAGGSNTADRTLSGNRAIRFPLNGRLFKQGLPGDMVPSAIRPVTIPTLSTPS